MSSSRSAKEYLAQVENLVFAGAGVDGTAYVGALLEFVKSGGDLRTVQRVAGASSGSIMALMVALNFSANRINSLYDLINFSKIPSKTIIGEVSNFIEHLSINNNKALREVLVELLQAGIGAETLTFAELKNRGGKDLFIEATMICVIDSVETLVSQIFSCENAPATQILDVIMASAAIPGYFPQVCLEEVSPGKYVVSDKGFHYIDGGVLCDLPERVFDFPVYMGCTPNDNALYPHKYNPKTIGFITYADQIVDDMRKGKVDMKPIPHQSVISFVTALVNGTVNRKESTILQHARFPERTVLIKNSGIAATDFNITDDQKKQLVANGEEAFRFYMTHKFPQAKVYSSGSATLPMFTPASSSTPVAQSTLPSVPSLGKKGQ
jgi:NTE family protein